MGRYSRTIEDLFHCNLFSISRPINFVNNLFTTPSKGTIIKPTKLPSKNNQLKLYMLPNVKFYILFNESGDTNSLFYIGILGMKQITLQPYITKSLSSLIKSTIPNFFGSNLDR